MRLAIKPVAELTIAWTSIPPGYTCKRRQSWDIYNQIQIRNLWAAFKDKIELTPNKFDNTCDKTPERIQKYFPSD